MQNNYPPATKKIKSKSNSLNTPDVFLLMRSSEQSHSASARPTEAVLANTKGPRHPSVDRSSEHSHSALAHPTRAVLTNTKGSRHPHSSEHSHSASAHPTGAVLTNTRGSRHALRNRSLEHSHSTLFSLSEY